MALQDFAKAHDFFLDRRRAQCVANLRKTEMKDLGIMGRGSYGLMPPDNTRQTMHVYAVEKATTNR